MSNGARAGVVALAVAIVVIAFVALKPGKSSDKQDDTANRAAQTTTTGGGDAKTSPKASTPMAPSRPLEVTLKGGAPVGGVKSLKVAKGKEVSLRVNTDEAQDQIHLHGYDIEKTTSASKPAVFTFKASIEGVFELESHTAEDAGREPLIARLVVEPN